MNLKSVAMATGLVLTFAAGAWLSTIMLAPPKRSNQVAVQDHVPAARPYHQLTKELLPQNRPERLPDMAASDSILPPLPPLPPSPAQTHPAPPSIAEAPAVEPPVIAAPPPPPADQALQAPEPEPPAIAEAPPAMAEAQPEAQPVPMAVAAPEPPASANPVAPLVETAQKADIDFGFAALSDLVTRAPSVSTPPPSPARRTPTPVAAIPPSPPSHPASSPAPAGSQVAGPYFTIQVGSFQDPANAASLIRSLGVKGWEAFVVDWANSTGQIWKVVRVGRYQTEAQAVSASAELMSAANLRGNVIKVR